MSDIDTTFPEKNIIKQIQCPTVAKPSYSFMGGIDATFGEFMPEVLAYGFGYGLTGQGDTSKGPGWDNAGMFQNKKNRVTGANYWVETDDRCNTKSIPNCANQKKFMYMRTYPITNAGMVTSTVEDVMDVNPVTLMESVIGVGNFSSTCEEIEMPVGNYLNDNAYQYPDQQSFQTALKNCIQRCSQTRFSNDTEADICNKNCTRGWWVESRCAPVPQGYKVKYGHRTYTIPSGVADITNLIQGKDPEQFSASSSLSEKAEKKNNLLPVSLLTIATLLILSYCWKKTRF